MINYRKTDTIMGKEGFTGFYERYQDKLDAIGKRPDILIFPKGSFLEAEAKDISGFGLNELTRIVPKTLARFDIRSSSFLSEKYKEARSSGIRGHEPTTDSVPVKNTYLLNQIL